MNAFRTEDRPEPTPVPRHRVARELVPELDELLASLSMLFHQYLKHQWLTLEPDGLQDLWLWSRRQVLHDMDLVAQYIILLGATPTSHPLEQVNLAYCDHEADGRFAMCVMLHHDLEHEAMLARHLCYTLRAANELGDAAAAELLQGLLRRAEDRAICLIGLLKKETLAG